MKRACALHPPRLLRRATLRIASILVGALWLVTVPASAQAGSCGSCSGCPAPLAGQALVCGCWDGVAGEIGCSSAEASPGQAVEIAVRVAAVNLIDSFSFDLEFPQELLRWDSTSVGTLTEGFDFFGASLHEEDSVVRVGGFEVGPDGIPPGTDGDLAVLHFTVLQAGCDAFCLTTLFDDISSYARCEHAAGTGSETAVDAASWGRIKATFEVPEDDPGIRGRERRAR